VQNILARRANIAQINRLADYLGLKNRILPTRDLYYQNDGHFMINTLEFSEITSIFKEGKRYKSG
jgi:hypothetical protein